MPPQISSKRACFFFQAEDGIRDADVTGVQTCALPISHKFANELGEDPLVTDYDTERGGRTLEYHRVRAGIELGDELGPAPDEPEQARERDELAKRDEVDLVVPVDNPTFR